jgi:methionyl-tRNA synthetase
MFICATDEHGTPAELAAAKAESRSMSTAPDASGAKGARRRLPPVLRPFRPLLQPQNHRLTQHFAGKLAEAGLIREVSEKQVFSIDDGRFLPDRYIEGTCPNCGYDKRRAATSARTAPSSWTRPT